jgi:hypothetical protein
MRTCVSGHVISPGHKRCDRCNGPEKKEVETLSESNPIENMDTENKEVEVAENAPETTPEVAPEVPEQPEAKHEETAKEEVPAEVAPETVE